MRSRKYQKSCSRVSSPEVSRPRGFGKLYKQPDCWVLYKPNRAASLSEFHYFAYLSLFLSLLLKTTFPYFKEKKKHSFDTELMKQASQWDSSLLAVVQMMYLQGRSSKQQQASAGALLSDNCFCKNTAYK